MQKRPGPLRRESVLLAVKCPAQVGSAAMRRVGDEAWRRASPRERVAALGICPESRAWHPLVLVTKLPASAT